jgi:hypothetical protein
MFRRLSFFIEKRGYRGDLAGIGELDDRHGWNAHNYRPEGLAAFFNAVADHRTGLTAQERELLSVVTEAGTITQRNGRWMPGEGGVLSISQESNTALRNLLITHEAMHGVFYSDPEFRDGVFQVWREQLTEREREYWRSYLGHRTYDPADEYLIVNEFQAYLLQQPLPEVRWVFGTLYAERFRNSGQVPPGYVDRFLTGFPDSFVESAQTLNELLWRETGLVGGGAAGFVQPGG